MTKKELLEKEEKNRIKQEKSKKTRESKKIIKEITEFLNDNNIPVDMITQSYIDEYVQMRLLLNRIDDDLATSGLVLEYTNKTGAVNFVNNPLVSERKHAANNMIKILKELSKLKKESNAKSLKTSGTKSKLNDFEAQYD